MPKKQFVTFDKILVGRKLNFGWNNCQKIAVASKSLPGEPSLLTTGVFTVGLYTDFTVVVTGWNFCTKLKKEEVCGRH
jgi:hypothetical protein